MRSTIDLAHNMNMKVTAEGVETEYTWGLLRAYGCDIALGYLLARPMPGKDFLIWAENACNTPAASTLEPNPSGPLVISF